MDLFAAIGENSTLELIAILLLLAIFGCAIAVLDHRVRRLGRGRRGNILVHNVRCGPVLA
jgi:hypothetical protein